MENNPIVASATIIGAASKPKTTVYDTYYG